MTERQRRIYRVRLYDAEGNVIRTKHYQTPEGATHFAQVCTQQVFGYDKAARAEIDESFFVEWRGVVKWTFISGAYVPARSNAVPEETK